MSRVDEATVRAELAELRAALATVEVPAIDDEVLRARFRAATRGPAPRAAEPRATRGGVRRYLVAAGVVLAVGAGLLFALPRGSEPSPPTAAAAPSPPPAATSAAFQPLPSSPGFSPTASYSVVRVRIPLASFAVVPGSEQNGSIEADLLVGEDGLAHGIRFTGGGAAVGSAQVQ